MKKHEIILSINKSYWMIPPIHIAYKQLYNSEHLKMDETKQFACEKIPHMKSKRNFLKVYASFRFHSNLIFVWKEIIKKILKIGSFIVGQGADVRKCHTHTRAQFFLLQTQPFVCLLLFSLIFCTRSKFLRFFCYFM